MKRYNLLSILAFVIFATDGNAVEYYISSSIGSDGNPGTQDLPWKNLSRLSETKLKAGDMVYLKRGDVWRETMTLSGSGEAQKPIVIQPYGDGDGWPEIWGSDAILGGEKNGVFSSRIPNGLSVKAAFCDGVPIPVSRYPDDTGWAYAQRIDGGTRVYAPDLDDRDKVGASIHFRSVEWAIETRRIRYSNSAYLDMSDPLYYPNRRLGFYVTNDSNSFLTSDGESWFQSAHSGVLYWKGGSRINARIEASVRQTGIFLLRNDWVEIRGIRVFGAWKYGVSVQSNYVRVVDCKLDYVGTGVYAQGVSVVVDSCDIYGGSNRGVYVSGRNAEILNNRIVKVGLQPALGPTGMDSIGGGDGVVLFGDSGVIRNNVIDSTGYNGIGFNAGYSTVERNIIAHSCMTTDDGGGIYTWSGSYDRTGNVGSVIRRNFVRDLYGNSSGLSGKYSGSYHGIYLDEASHGVVVDSNIVANCAVGIFLHNTWDVVVRGNLLFENKKSQVGLQHDSTIGAGIMKGNVLQGNTLLAKSNQKDSLQVMKYDQREEMASWKDNHHCFDNRISIVCDKNGSIGWRYDRSAQVAKVSPELVSDGGFDQVITPWRFFPDQNRFARDSGLQCDSGYCAKVVVSPDVALAGTQLMSANNISTTGTVYLKLSYRIRGTLVSKGLRFVLRDHLTGAVFAEITNQPVYPFWHTAAKVLSVASSMRNSRLEVFFPKSDTVFWLDDVSLRIISREFYDSLPETQLYVNSSVKSQYSASPKFGAWSWVTSNRATVKTIGDVGWGIVLHPLEKNNIIHVPRVNISTTRVKPAVVRSNNMFIVQGLTGSAKIIDYSGRHINDVNVDHVGTGVWIWDGTPGTFFLCDKSHCFPIVVMR